MLPHAEEQAYLHAMSQLVYLDAAPAVTEGGAVTVGGVADYYLQNPAGQVFLKRRFGSIRREYDLWLTFLSEGVQRWRDWRIIHILDDNNPETSGFYGCTFRSPDRLTVVAFRGSEMLGNPCYQNDYRNDFSLSWAVPTAQQRLVDRYWRRVPAAGPFWVTGHSLGGNLALYGAATMPGYLWSRCLGCFALNAPGFNREFLREYAGVLEKRRERIHALQNQFDVVSSLLLDAVEPVLARSAHDPAEHAGLFDLMYPHSNFQFARGEDSSFVLLEDGKKCGLCRMASRLTELFLALPIPLRKELSERILEAIYAPKAQEKRRRSVLDAITGSLSRHTGNSAVRPVAEVAYTAGLLGDAGLAESLYESRGVEGPFGSRELARVLLLLLKTRTEAPEAS